MYFVYATLLCPACTQSTTSIPVPTQQTIAVANYSHAPTVTNSSAFHMQSMEALTLQRSSLGVCGKSTTTSMDIELNVVESKEITGLRKMSHHWPASYYSCQIHLCSSEPPIDKDKGNPTEFDRHGKITEDNTNKSSTYNSDPVDYGNTPKSLACVKKQVRSGK